MEAELAKSILGGMTRPFGLGGYFAPEHWREAAQYAVDSGDWSEFKWMLAREVAWEEFAHSRFNAADFDFDDYCDRYAPEAAKIGD